MCEGCSEEQDHRACDSPSRFLAQCRYHIRDEGRHDRAIRQVRRAPPGRHRLCGAGRGARQLHGARGERGAGERPRAAALPAAVQQARRRLAVVVILDRGGQAGREGVGAADQGGGAGQRPRQPRRVQAVHDGGVGVVGPGAGAGGVRGVAGHADGQRLLARRRDRHRERGGVPAVAVHQRVLRHRRRLGGARRGAVFPRGVHRPPDRGQVLQADPRQHPARAHVLLRHHPLRQDPQQGVVGPDERGSLPAVLRLDERVHVHHGDQRADRHVPSGVAIGRRHHPSADTEPLVPELLSVDVEGADTSRVHHHGSGDPPLLGDGSGCHDHQVLQEGGELLAGGPEPGELQPEDGLPQQWRQ
uniref:Uncharacterized protein n=1 Tax=Arundo donax TaxID=35708 RepID=A0A0A9DXJ2_ARUDO